MKTTSNKNQTNDRYNEIKDLADARNEHRNKKDIRHSYHQIYCELLIDDHDECRQTAGTYSDCKKSILEKCDHKDMNSENAKYWLNRRYIIRTVDNVKKYDSYNRMVSDHCEYVNYDYVSAIYKNGKVELVIS